jgi:hypothetical protein
MRVCVFCGASPAVEASFLELAAEMGKALAAKAEHVIFGGGGVGMMGALASAVLAGGGKVIGVLPRFLFEREPPHPGVADIRVVDTMHERKAIMYSEADAFVILPGGFGTLDETLEAVTWRQLALHAKPVLFIGGDFWRGLRQQFDAMHAHGFLSDRDRGLVSFYDTPAEAVSALASP